jgi:hypothetical protein
LLILRLLVVICSALHDGYGGAVRWKNKNSGFRYDKDVANAIYK